MQTKDQIPNRGEWLLIASFYLLVSLYATYPLINYFTRAIPYVFLPDGQAALLPLVSGDHLQTYYWFWLFKDNVLGQSPLFTNPYEFNITGGHIPHGYAQFPVSILFLLLSVFGNVFAHNLLILLTFAFSGLSLYYLLRLWGLSRSAAFLGGLVFTLAPSRQTQLLSGHINGYVWFLIPLSLYFFEKGYRKQHYGPVVLSGICILCLAMVETHLLYFFLLFLGLYLPARIVGPWLLRWEIEAPSPATRGSVWPPILVLSLGALSGYAIYLTHTVVHQEPASGLAGGFAIGFYSLVFYFSWLLTSQFFCSLTGRPLAETRKNEALSYLPSLALVFSPIPSLFPLPFMRKAFFLIVFLGMIILKIRLHKKSIRRLERPAFPGPPLKKVAAMVLVIFFFLGLAGGFNVVSKKALVEDSIVGQGRTWQEVALYSPELSALFQRDNRTGEAFIYPGFIPLALWVYLLIDLFFTPWSWRSRDRYRFWFFTVILILSYAIAFGVHFSPVFPLYRFLYNYFPFFKYPRDPARIIFLSFLCWGLISAAGLEVLRKRLNRPSFRVRAVSFLAAGLILLVTLWDYHPQKKIGLSLLDEENPIYQALRRMPSGDLLVLGLPMFPGDSHQSSLYEYYITQSAVRMVNGYSPVVARRYVDKVFWPLVGLNVGELSRESYEQLRELGVKYLVHHQELYFYKVSPFTGYSAFKNLSASPYLKLIRTNMAQSLFQILPPGEVTAHPPQYFRENTGVIFEIEEMRRRSGKAVKDPEASMGRAVEAARGPDQSGLVAYQAYRFFPSGPYEAAFHLQSSGNTQPLPVLRVEAVTFFGKKVIAHRELRGTDFSRPGHYERFTLSFEVRRPEILEFRVYAFGRETTRSDKIVVSFADRPSPPVTYEARELFRYLIKPVPDPEAGGGWALRTDPNVDHPAYILFGPHQTYEPGSYQARFRLKTASVKTAGPFARVDVAAQTGTIICSQKEITGRDFTAPERYEEVILPFTLTNPEELEFRVFTYNRIPFSIDRIVVEKAP